MTNAHVVAGVRQPEVELGDGTSVTATVVLYDPAVDVAVLALDDGDLPHLVFDRDAAPRDGVAIVGYPQDGPYDVQTGRIRSEQRLRSPDIYGDGTVIREVFSLRGLVRAGNSGGPILSSGGDVVGLVFAASVTDPDTGYALTADQVAESAARGLSRRGGRRHRGLHELTGDQPLPLRAAGISRPWLIARSGALTCLTCRSR